MAFVSIRFVAFVILVATLYFLAPLKYRWIVLLGASYVFFWMSSKKLLLVLICQTCITYACGRWMSVIEARYVQEHQQQGEKRLSRKAKAEIKARKKTPMVLGVIANLLFLLILKYYNFFIDNINRVIANLGTGLPHLKLLMPIGLSFYTLQAIAYVVDVYRGKAKADTSLPRFMLFMSYFPQILQGPIPRYSSLADQLYEGHRFDYRRLCHGAQLMLWGYFQKMVIADRIAIPVNQLFDYWEYYYGWLAFLAAAGYGLQVYCDFAGGINIARGFSEVLGIELAENFNQPYASRSIEEFWRRWHITLGRWMRDYVFYPLTLSSTFVRIGKGARKRFGGSVGKKIPPFLAMFIVYFLVGFWHGPNWTYIVYGIWNGIFIMCGILFEEQYANAKRFCHVDEDSLGWMALQMLRTFVICSIGRFFSRAATMTQAMGMIGSMGAGWYDFTFLTDGTLGSLGLDTANWVILLLGILILCVVDYIHERGIGIREVLDHQYLPIRWLFYLSAIAAVLVFGVYGSGYNAASFIYQGF